MSEVGRSRNRSFLCPVPCFTVSEPHKLGWRRKTVVNCVYWPDQIKTELTAVLFKSYSHTVCNLHAQLLSDCMTKLPSEREWIPETYITCISQTLTHLLCKRMCPCACTRVYVVCSTEVCVCACLVRIRACFPGIPVICTCWWGLPTTPSFTLWTCFQPRQDDTH